MGKFVLMEEVWAGLFVFTELKENISREEKQWLHNYC